MKSHVLWQAESIAAVLYECGVNALSGRTRESWRLKSDGSLVTALDISNESLLRERLTSLIPGSGFLGEETLLDCSEEEIAAAFRGDCWVVDPIDGTAPFANGFPNWAVSIGLMHDGVLVDGGVILPEAGILMVTRDEDVLCSHRIDMGAGRVHGLELFTPLAPLSGSWNAGGMILLGQEVTRRYTLEAPNPLLVTGSAVCALASLLLGRGLAYVGTVKLYDVAGMLPMAARLGCGMRLDGAESLGTAVTERVCRLSASEPDRWKMRGVLTAAAETALPEAVSCLGLERH